MTHFQTYQFVLCLIVFVTLTVLFSALLGWIIRLNLRLIRLGANDDKIKAEYIKNQAKRPSVLGKIVDRLVLCLCCAVLLITFAFSVGVSLNDGRIVEGTTALKVVQSDSMSYINEKHPYVKPGDYDDQFDMFDLVTVSALPEESELKIGDIVVYEYNGVMIIHRIVGIEAPNSSHEDYYFLLQGDANETADRFPVRYEQMKGLYTGQRLPMIGSFVMFMQSPAGWLCILLVVIAVIATPILEKKLKDASNARLALIFAGKSTSILQQKREKRFIVERNTAKIIARIKRFFLHRSPREGDL